MDTPFRLSDTTAAKAAHTWSEWSTPTTDGVALDSILRTPFFSITKADTPSEIFSAQSTLTTECAIGSMEEYPPHSTSQPWQVSVFLMLVLCYYVYVTFHYRSIIPAIVKTSNSVSKTLESYSSRNTSEKQLDRHSQIMSIIALVTLVISLDGTPFSHTDWLIKLGVITIAICTLFLYRVTIIALCSKFCDNKTSFTNLVRINSHNITLLAILYTPIAIVSYANRLEGEFALYILATVWIYYAVRYFNLFITNGFGKLQWFLYLCTVEILPVSYLVALAVRY